MATFRVGDRVYFGRPNGEQTLGEVVKVNAASVKVRQLEERGAVRSRPAGTIWKVAPSLVRLADPSAATPPAARRPEAEVMLDVVSCYCSLSPENLTGDGEHPASFVRKRRSQLNTRLAGLFRELGRRVSEEEAYAWDAEASKLARARA
jgi:hypothetical protein